MIEVVEYVDAEGNSPFARWFDRLDRQAAAKVTVALLRMEQGNLSNAKALGGGLSEYKIHFGPGYRVYFAMQGQRMIILLGGGSKARQDSDIAAAQSCWAAYKRRSSAGMH